MKDPCAEIRASEKMYRELFIETKAKLQTATLELEKRGDIETRLRIIEKLMRELLIRLER